MEGCGWHRRTHSPAFGLPFCHDDGESLLLSDQVSTRNHCIVCIKLISPCRNTTGNDMASHLLYQSTHRHAAPWLIGFLFGYFLHVNRGKRFQLSALAVITGWLLCLSMLAASLFALYPASRWSAPVLSTVEESLYYTLSRLAWPLALCWIVFACVQGYGSLANSFLSSPLWQPLSRLSYSVYIWHMFVVEVNSKSVRTGVYFSDYSAVGIHFYERIICIINPYMLPTDA